MSQVIDGKIILGIEDAPLVDAIIAWTDRVKARIAADEAKLKSAHNSSQPEAPGNTKGG